MSEAQHKHKSVFGEIVDWTLAPLLILWPISMAIQYFFAYSIANNAYDRELRDSVVAISKQLAYDNGRIRVNTAAAAAAILRADEDDQTFFQVRDQRNEVVGGERAIPLVEFQPELAPQTVYFRDDHIPGYEVRVAYIFAQVPGMPGAVLVQVAETVGKRSRLASEIIGDVLAAQFLIVPIALLFVWLGLTRGHRAAQPADRGHPPPQAFRPLRARRERRAGGGAAAHPILQRTHGPARCEPAGAGTLRRRRRAPDAHAARRAQDAGRDRDAAA